MNNSAFIYKLPMPHEKANSKSKKKPNILDDLPAFNKKREIKIRAKKLSDKTHSPYFHVRINGKQDYQFLKLYIHNKRETRKNDEETLNLALKLRDKKELELFENENIFN